MGLEMLRRGEIVTLVCEDDKQVEAEVLESFGWRGLVKGVAVCRVARLVEPEQAHLAVRPYVMRQSIGPGADSSVESHSHRTARERRSPVAVPWAREASLWADGATGGPVTAEC